VPENAPAPSGRSANRATQDFNDANHNPTIYGILMANVYRDLALRFIHNPQSNIVMIHMTSLGNGSGRSKVTIELEIVDDV
jgi:hypothetical protein